MNGELAIRLSEYERKSPIRCDADLSAALDSIICSEMAKSASRRDLDLIDEATDAALMIQGFDPEEASLDAARIADGAIASIPSDDKKTSLFFSTRWLIPAVILTALLFAVAVAAKVFDDEFLSALYGAKDEIAEASPGQVIEIGGESVEVGLSDEISSLGELVPRVRCESLLLPEIGDDEIGSIDLSDFGTYQNVTVTLADGASFDIKTDTVWKNTMDTEKVGKFDVVTSNYDSVYQGEFEYKGCLYRITADSEARLRELILCMGDAK